MAEYICPHCKNPLYDDDALSCLFCGENLHRRIGFLGKMKYPRPKIIVIVLVSLILVAFIALILL